MNEGTSNKHRASQADTENLDFPPLTVGVVTYPGRELALSKLLRYLAVAVANYPGSVFLRVGNNGGIDEQSDIVNKTVQKSPIASQVDWKVINSCENNIAVGRNLVLDATHTRLLAFIDDDEFPREKWLVHLVRGWQTLNCTIVAGPILPVFEPGTPHWVTTVDLHNSNGKKTGDLLDAVSSGNFLADITAFRGQRFDPVYGKSGGSDTDLFTRLRRMGCTIRWVSDAIVDEDVPLNRATSLYMIKRFTTQGALYRKIKNERGRLHNLRSRLQSLRIFIAGILVSPLYVAIQHPRAGFWVKRTFFHFGIWIKSPGKELYK